MISSLSRVSYDSPIGLSSFKESGSIEFSADVALALDFEAMYTSQVNAKGKVEIDLNHERSVPVRSLLLTVLKNRLGQAGTQIAFDFTPAGNLRVLLHTVAAKLLLVPLVLVGLGYALGLRGVELFLVVAVFGTPVASGSYPMAMNMGGDGPLAGQLVFVSTLAAVPTLFLWIFAMSALGLL